MTPEERKKDQERRNQYINTPGKLPLSEFQPKFTFTFNKGMADFNVNEFINPEKEGYIIDYDVYLSTKGMNLQRPLVWTNLQKEQLIISILKGTKIPAITVVKHRVKNSDTIVKVIDGKQRLTTLVAFVRNEFSFEFKDKRYYHNDLTDQAKHTINNCLTTDICNSYDDAPISDNDMIRLFEQINWAGTPQDKDHMNKLNNSL